MKEVWIFLIISIYILYNLNGCYASTSFAVEVHARDSECFYEEINRPGTNVELNFAVIRGGALDIKLRISGPPAPGNTGQSNVIYDAIVQFSTTRHDMPLDSGVRGFIATEAGVYTFCFDNTMSYYTPKVITFTIKHADSDSHEKRAAKSTDLDPLQWAISRISGGLATVEHEQELFRSREQNHRDIAEETASRVLYYAVGESMFVFSLSLVQIFFLRRWFNQKSHRTV